MALSRTRLESNLKAIGAKNEGVMCKMARQLQAKHHARLQAKLQADVVLLEEMKDFLLRRSKLDMEYYQGLSRLVAQHLRQHNWQEAEGGSQPHTMLGAFKTALEETDATAGAIRDMADGLAKLSDQISAEAKQRTAMAKKFSEYSVRLQVEFEAPYREFDKARKQYEDMEAKAAMAQAKCDALDGKKKGGLKLFQDPKAEEMKRNKTQDRLSMATTAAAITKNSLILVTLSMTAFGEHYHGTGLPTMLADLDGNIYNNVSSFLRRYAHMQREAANALLRNCDAMDERTAKISKESEEKAVIAQLLAQTASTLTVDADAAPPLSELVNDPATNEKLVRAMKKASWEKAEATKAMAPLATTIDTVRRQMASEIKAGLSNPESMAWQDTMIFESSMEMALPQWTVSRATAVIEALKAAGLEVPMGNLEAEADSRSTTSNSTVFTHSSPTPVVARTVSRSRPSTEVQTQGVRCRAIYAYVGSGLDDELSVEEDEIVYGVEKPMDGWIKVRNRHGREGYVPESYMDVMVPHSPSPPPPPPRPLSLHAAVVPHPHKLQKRRKAIAIYDYEGETEDELSFAAGDVIEVLEMESEVDDGYWRGVLRGQEGAFPSMVVELQD